MASVHILVPAQRYVFAVSNGEAEAATVDSSAEGFERYKALQQGGRTQQAADMLGAERWMVGHGGPSDGVTSQS